ncbi:alkyl sulfatase [Maricaulis sp. W15]|uniref:alkyl/aryl-sulfatase n=1 Tax=Maricaulis sp. W15 TaxID=1772333 RepID=UPI00094908AF|nr:alkyl sulfatase dimerization domain-containing protein [Maricaulis sp. W15]OLF71334.1 alkyl sulfatase [Maricaulis sp. W15]
MRLFLGALTGLALILVACGERQAAVDVTSGSDAAGFLPASDATAQANARLARTLDGLPSEDEALANRGFVASDENLTITDPDGAVIWRPADYGFLAPEPAASVHPGLWRQARLNQIHGLFEVEPGIHQVRGYDLANMSVITGETGWIIIDPLTSVETARAALDLVNRELGDRPVSAVILTHSHIDHFGGIGAVAGPETPIIAPAGFLEAAVSENVMAGIVMGRRAGYMYGTRLPRTQRGHVGSGLGKHPALGTHTIATPTHVIDETGQTLEIDGVRMEFQYAPETEAPAELTVFFPDLRAWCGAELVSRTLHNLYTLRGAEVRDALAWSAAIAEALDRFGPRTSVIFNSHHWPVWGQSESRAFLTAQRDVYKYIHDQTLRLAAQGLGPDEIAETITLPESLAGVFAVQGYYGTLKHNSRAVYQRYFGWFDGVPAHLDPIPRVEAAQRYVEALGGVDAVVMQASHALDAGEYRWSAELAQHAVFAAPREDAAREVLARAYEQLGYAAESAPWRDFYLTGAFELRHGVEALDATAAGSAILQSIPLDMFFAAMATRLDGNRAARRDRVFNFVFADVGETHVIRLSNGVMHHQQAEAVADADASVTLTRAFWLRLLQQEVGLMEMIGSDQFAITGDRLALLGFFAMLEQPQPDFAIVTP